MFVLDLEDEDDGVLMTVLYNVTSDSSIFAIFDARTLEPISMNTLEHVFPFHAHGIVCRKDEDCFTNP